MYRLIQGNIKQLVDQALLAEQGFIPQVPPHSSARPTPPPLPPRMHLNSSTPYSPPGRSRDSVQRVVGAIFIALDNDPRSIRAAELKNQGQWDEARTVEYEIFQEHMRTLGAEHVSTLSVGYNLAEIELQSSYLAEANKWAEWVSENVERFLGRRHALTMKTESLMAEILCEKGQYQEAESICANVLARQQMNIGEEHLDTLETRRRLAKAYNALRRRDTAIMTAEKLQLSLERLLGNNHIRVFVARLDLIEYMLYNHSETTELVSFCLRTEVHQALDMLPRIYQDLSAGCGPSHPLSLWALTLEGRGLVRAQQQMEASETLRRALTMAEESLGPEHPMAMEIVGNIGVMYAVQGSQYYLGNVPPSEALPWLTRYLNWVERRKGTDNPETQATLEMLGNLHFAAQDYEPAQKYFERALASWRGASSATRQRLSNQLQICQATTMITGRTMGSGFGSFLSALKRY